LEISTPGGFNLTPGFLRRWNFYGESFESFGMLAVML